MKFKGFSYDDPSRPMISTAYFDGYSFGDRLLEGVMFRATCENGNLVVSFVSPNGEYERLLNQQHWLVEAQKFAEGNDIFSDKSDGMGEDVALEMAEGGEITSS